MKKDKKKETKKARRRQAAEVTALNNVTPIKPDHASATARIATHGLSVLCFNTGRNCAQIGFFRDQHSPLRMKIFRKNGTELWSTTEDSRISRIRINTGNPGIGLRYENSISDDEDFRHMPNLEGDKFYNKPLGKKLNPHVHFSAIVNINKGIFYTYEKSTSEAIRYNVPAHSTHHPRISPRNLGQIGKFLGADIFDTTVAIEITGTNFPDPPPPLQKADGHYSIFIWTHADDENNHFKHIFDVIEKVAADPEHSMEFTGQERGFPFEPRIADVPCQDCPIGEGDLGN